MAHFVVPAENGDEIEPVGHCQIYKPIFSDKFRVVNTLDAHREGTLLIEGAQADCNRFVTWVIQQLRKGEQVIDPKAFHTNTRATARR